MGFEGLLGNDLNRILATEKKFGSINVSNSSKLCITYGVPQGSILEPLHFIIYIYDIYEIACFAKFVNYADDANTILTTVGQNRGASYIRHVSTIQICLKGVL